MHIETFFDKYTFTFTHVIVDEANKKCAVLDSVTDFDRDSGKVSFENADKVITYIEGNKLQNEWILESHIHADHITAASYLKNKIGGKTAMGSGIKSVLDVWIPKFNTSHDTKSDGSQFDVLFEDNGTFNIGELEVKIWHTPGHTPACAVYIIEDTVFTGDTVLASHIGTARCDFPGGSAEDLYNSITRLYSLPDSTKMILCHDYPAKGDTEIVSTTIAEQKKNNKMIKANTTLQEYTNKRSARDKTLSVPRLLLPSIQANMRLGEFGNKEDNGMQYIKIPVVL